MACSSYHREFCRRAQIVSVASSSIKYELVQHFRLPDSKVKVVAMAPAVDTYPVPSREKMVRVREKYELPDSFLFYPANTWQHKNHIGLLESLYHLRRQQNIRPTVICTGKKEEYFSTIQKYLKKFGLYSQVRFIGFVSPLELQCLYRLCKFLIFPSKYEGWGLPVTEALRISVPIACSDLVILKEQTCENAIFFNPKEPKEIAEAIHRLWIDEELCKKLSEQGPKIAARFNWEKTTHIFRAYYRLLARRPLTEEDQIFLKENTFFCQLRFQDKDLLI